jgi:competence protein ComEA
MSTSTPTSSISAAGGAAEPQPAYATQFHLASYLLGLVTALVLLGGALFLLRRPAAPAVELHAPPLAPTPAPAATAAPPTPSPIIVFVSGAVRQPGLYTLPAGARIGDAVAAAGGLLPYVEPALVNQAQPLTDGAQLHIPAADAGMAAASASTGTGASTGTDAAGDTGAAGDALPAPAARSEPRAGLTGALPTATPSPAAGATGGISAGEAMLPPAASGAAAAPVGGLVNVNSATAAELEALPGIGPAKAQAIIENRPFSTVEELDRVPGIGPATLDRLRPLVTTG